MVLFPTEVGRYFAPFLSLPFDDGITEIMRLEPVFGTGDNLEELFRLWRALQLCLALPLRHPENGIVTVGIDGLIGQALLPTEGKGMHDGQEFTDIISAMNRAVMKHLIACLQVYRLIFHRARIARTGRIHRPRVGPHFHRKGKYGVMTVRRGINEFGHRLVSAYYMIVTCAQAPRCQAVPYHS